MFQVRGTNCYLPIVDGFDASRLRGYLTFEFLGKLSRHDFPDALATYFAALPSAPVELPERLEVVVPQTDPDEYQYLPSDQIGHQVSRPSPLQCWQELVVRAMRFGQPARLKKGLRLELLNVRAVVREPSEAADSVLQSYGFRVEQFRAYQRKILDPVLPEGISYTYGNRLRGHFDQGQNGRDTLETVIHRLSADPETRHCYVSLWDTAQDLAQTQSDDAVPCLTTLFFRRAQGALTMTATYRSHNLLTAWLENVYGLMAVQDHVARRIGAAIGPLTVISHSLTIDPSSTRLAYGDAINQSWKSDDDFIDGKYRLREDPCGYFVVTSDSERGELVAEHRYAGVLVKQYRGRRAHEIEAAVVRDMAVSLISHAMWLGRELAQKEQALRVRCESL